jgi:hypothetical protein
VALAAGCVLAAGGCGSGSSSTSTGAGNTLRADVLALTQAAAARQWSTADQALAQLRSDLIAAVAAGGVSAERAQAIRADVAAVTADLAARRAAAAPSTSSSPSTQPKPPPKPTKPPKDEHVHDHGPGHGHGGD